MRKVISGGQTGADQGALVGARQAGLETGGWMPKGFRTEFGPRPWLAEVYGLQAHPSEDYPPRTRQNVKDADGTVWVGATDDGRGFTCTLKAVEKFNKPFLNDPDPITLRQWAEHYHIEVLNVAGPRASHDRQAHKRAAMLIIEAFAPSMGTGDRR
jgi:hypothetical protein